jgi:hypothetical protein
MQKWKLISIIIVLASFNIMWGFFGHKKINNYAIFLLPPEMISFYKSNMDFIVEHSIDPDKRRYAIAAEAPRHYLDLDHYGKYPYDSLPRNWYDAVAKYTEDTLNAHGVGPWWVLSMQKKLTDAFKEGNKFYILKYSAEIGHYISDLHVPLHASSNHNGQHSGQHGIHGFWESRLPELFCDAEYDFFIGNANYIEKPNEYIWSRMLESGKASDSVLQIEAALNNKFPNDQKYAFETKGNTNIKTYSTAYSAAYQTLLDGMVERRMRQAVYSVASFWYTAWVDAGQPDLKKINNKTISAEDLKEYEKLEQDWNSGKVKGRICD